MKQQNAFTMIEAMVTLAILMIIAFCAVKLLVPISTFFQKSQVRQHATMEARQGLDTMRRFLSDAKASTVQICSCNNQECKFCTATPGVPPNSQIDFETQDGHFRSFYWENDHTLMMLDRPSAMPPARTMLAKNVTGVIFTLDFRDPAIINVSLQIDAPLDSSGGPNSLFTLIQPNQIIRMTAGQ